MICVLCGHPVDGSEQQKRGNHQHERMYARLFHLYQSCGNRIEPESLLAKPHELSHIKKVVGICSGKGGVGKKPGHLPAGGAGAAPGPEGGILDADITGPSIPKAFGIREKAMGTDAGILPVKTTTGIDVMSLNLLLDNDSDPVVWRGPVIAGAVGQFWTDVIWGDKDVLSSTCLRERAT